MPKPPALTRRHALRAVAAASTGAFAGPAWAQGEEIRIGQSAHLSGPLASTMAVTLKGQDLAFDEINRAGGINGRPVKLIQRDDGYDPARCVANARELIEKTKPSPSSAWSTAPALPPPCRCWLKRKCR